MEREEQSSQFEAVKARLEEIANQVDDENLSLDEALDLYEEAVKLGLQASDLLEIGIEVDGGEPVEGTSPEGAEVVPDDAISANPDTSIADQPAVASQD